MTFRDDANFEGGRVRKSSGRRGATIAAGGGLGAVVLTLVASLLSGNGLDVAGLLEGLTGSGTAQSTSEASYLGQCSGTRANTDRDCRVSATAIQLDRYWTDALPKQANVEYVVPEVHSFTGSVQTACGAASADTGPFYCPPDQTVYLDVSFYDELTSRFGASGGNLAEEYVLAHEFGHHIQNLIGIFGTADRRGTGADSDSVRVELMADCLAGMWVGNATSVNDPKTGKPVMEPLTETDIEDALSAAAAVGDDHIQQRTSGQVNPHSFTHGTSEQRMNWFTKGYQGGTIQTCNALEASKL